MNVKVRSAVGKVAIILAMVFVMSSTHAEICKIVDNSGKVTFKQMRECSAGEKLEMKLAKDSFTLPEQELDLTLDRYVGTTHPPKWLLLDNITYFKGVPAQDVVGRYLFGKGCVAPQNTSLESIKKNHPDFLPSESSIIAAFNAILPANGYGSLRPLSTAAQQREHIVIQPNIVNLTMEVCAPRAKPGFVQLDPEKFESKQFRKSAVSVEIEWTLTNSVDGSQLTFTTTGQHDTRKTYVDKAYSYTAVYLHLSKAIAASFVPVLKQDKVKNLIPANTTYAQQELSPVAFDMREKILIGVIILILLLAMLRRITRLIG